MAALLEAVVPLAAVALPAAAADFPVQAMGLAAVAVLLGVSLKAALLFLVYHILLHTSALNNRYSYHNNLFLLGIRFHHIFRRRL